MPCAVRAVCTINTVTRAEAPAGNCCRQSSYALETTCDTVLHERRNAAGALQLTVDPMTGCAPTTSGETCTRTGNAATCVASGADCPYSAPRSGAPTLLVGTYDRRISTLTGAPTLADHYWTGCERSPRVFVMQPTCTLLPPATEAAAMRMTVIRRTGPGVVTAVRSWTRDLAAMVCTIPTQLPAITSLGSTKFFEGVFPGGGFGGHDYTCTYTFTKK